MATPALCPKCHRPHPEGATCPAMPGARRAGPTPSEIRNEIEKTARVADAAVPVHIPPRESAPTDPVPEEPPAAPTRIEAQEPGRGLPPSDLPGPEMGLLGRRYRLEAPLGVGGMGEVYRATDTRLGRKVAVKRIVGILADDPEIIRRFQAEIRATARVEHPNVVDILDKGQDEKGRPYFVLEYLEGKTLRQLVKEGGPLPFPRARRILEQMLRGLAKAHAQKVIHRDLKPHNIMLVGDGDDLVKILDFGIAKALDVATGQQTKAGQVIGTPAYMSPEVATGKSASHPTVDIYSVGVIAYELLTGALPFGTSLEENIMARAQGSSPPSLKEKAPDAPAELDSILKKAMASDPRHRYQSAEELRVALAEVKDGKEEEEKSVSVAVLSPGTVIDGRYRVERRLGEGGFAIVYLAKEERIGRRCAVKFLFSEGSSLEPALRKRFFQDAGLAAQIDHANVIRIFATGEWQGVPYIAMEYVEGKTLREKWPAIDWPAFVALVSQVAEALEAIHEKGIVHRDLAPENILIDQKGQAKVLDFGIARRKDSTLTHSSLGYAIGRLGYMSPEQAFDPRTATALSDQFSLAAIVYEALVGLPPYVDADDPAGPEGDQIISDRLLSKKPPRSPKDVNPAVPSGLVALLFRALSFEPKDRFPSARAFAQALSGFGGASLELPTQSTASRDRSRQRKGERGVVSIPGVRRPVHLPSILLALLLVAIIGASAVGIAIGLKRRAEEPDAPATEATSEPASR